MKIGVVKQNNQHYFSLFHEEAFYPFQCVETEEKAWEVWRAILSGEYVFAQEVEQWESLEEGSVVVPVPKLRKNIICVGKNYREHAIEMAGEQGIPEDIIIFTKAPTTVIGPNAIIPNHATITEQLDYEGELAVIIGKRGCSISKEEALDYVFGYTILNDVTARDLQSKHKQFFLGKSLDGTCPIGPWIVTKDELPNVQNLTVKTTVNGEVRQHGSTSEMTYSISEIIAEVSKGMTLEVGDIIATGTPAGVGKGMKPPRFLRSGDEIVISIEGIGTLRNIVE